MACDKPQVKKCDVLQYHCLCITTGLLSMQVVPSATTREV